MYIYIYIPWKSETIETIVPICWMMNNFPTLQKKKMVDLVFKPDFSILMGPQLGGHFQVVYKKWPTCRVKIQPFCSLAAELGELSFQSLNQKGPLPQRSRTRRWQSLLELPWNTHSPPADGFSFSWKKSLEIRK